MLDCYARTNGGERGGAGKKLHAHVQQLSRRHCRTILCNVLAPNPPGNITFPVLYNGELEEFFFGQFGFLTAVDVSRDRITRSGYLFQFPLQISP